MGITDIVRRRKPEERSDQAVLSFNDYLNLVQTFGYNGVQYSTPGSAQEQVAPIYQQLAAGAYKADSIVFACLQVRNALFSEARFQFRQIRNGRPGDLFGTKDLSILEAPWPGATTGDLLNLALTHHDLGGNAFIANLGDRLACLRPDWVTMIVGSHQDAYAALWDPNAEVVGYKYEPGGAGSEQEPVFFLAEEVAHFATVKDPQAQFRGMSLLTPVIREIMADKAATDHKLEFFEHAATPNLLVKLDVPDLEQFEAYVRKFREGHEGVGNAYKTLFTAAGADAQVIGADMKQMDFKVTQGAGETRIAAALGVPPVIAGLSEGLQGSSLNSGNFEASMRRFVDVTMRPLWRNMAGSLARIVNVPAGAELWYDDRDIPALREDVKKAGERGLAQSQTIQAYIMAGFDPDACVEAVASGDVLRLLGAHTGLVSVQMQKPATESPGEPENGPGETPSEPEPSSSGSNTARTLEDELGMLLSTSLERENARLKAELAARQTFEIHNHLPELPAASLSIADGAFRTEIASPPPAEVNLTLQTPEAPSVEFHEGAIRTEIAAPPPAEVNVNVEAAEPAHVDVKIETERLADAVLELAEARKAEKPAEITVNTPDVRFEPQIDVHVPEQRADVVVNVPEGPAAVVNVTNEVQTPEVTVNVPEGPAPVVNVNIDEEPLDATVTFKRNPNGTLKSADITENPED